MQATSASSVFRASTGLNPSAPKGLFVTLRLGLAVVVGGSIGGMLAARVPSEFHEKVTLVDRDALPTLADSRRGVPQAAHSHGLPARGCEVFEQLFPRFTADLTAYGGTPPDIQRGFIRVDDGHRPQRSESDLKGLSVSRPMLGSYTRRRIAAVPHIGFKERHTALGLLTSADHGGVTGVSVMSAEDHRAQEQLIEADLVVDATGRGNRGPTWPAAIGYEKPAEDRIDSGMTYVSRQYRRVARDTDFGGVLIAPWPELRRGGVAFATDGDRWAVTLTGIGEEAPPTDADAYLRFAKSLASNEIYDLVSRAESITAPLRTRLPVGVRRRYERLTRLPEGFLALADAICSFTPTYGQGMTVATTEAVSLRECLAEGRQRLPRRFFARAERLIDVPWDSAVGADLRYPEVEGPGSAKVRLVNGYVARVHQAAERHAKPAYAFPGVANVMAPSTKFFSPGVVSRVLRTGRRRPSPARKLRCSGGPGS
jgi:2-polyprenyl-6-methoxyphenol hydroxylase-like FAD-dependent oxidoreductase